MLTNSNFIGQYGQVTTEWSGGIIDMRTHHASKTENRIPNYAGVSGAVDENGFLIGTYTGKILELGLVDNSPTNMYVTNDGTKMYLAGSNNSRIYQYTLSTPFDISTAQSISNASAGAGVSGIYIKSDGTKMFVVNPGTDVVNSYTFGVPWDITTIVNDNKTYSIGALDTLPYGITVHPDGTKFWTAGSSGIREFIMSTPWDLATTSYSKVATIPQDTSPRSVIWNSTGTVFMVLGNTNDIIYAYSVPTAWDITNRVLISNTGTMNNMLTNQTSTNPTGFYFVPGTKNFYVSDASRRAMFWFTSNAVDQLGNGVNGGRLSFSESLILSGFATPRTVQFKPDGTAFYVSDNTTNVIREYSCNAPWTITDATVAQTVPIQIKGTSTQFASATRFHFSNDGTDVFFSDFTTGAMSRYGLRRAWDISTTYFKSTAPSAIATSSNGFCFSRDGLSLYYISGVTFFRKTMTNPWDITTLSAATSFADSTYLGANTLTGVWVSQKGEYLYGMTAATARIYKYKMTTPHNLTTATFYSHGYIEDISPDPLSGLFMHPYGDLLFVTDQTNDRLYKFSLNGG